MHEYSSSTTLQYLLTYVLVPCCAYSQLTIQLYSVYRRGTEVHSPPQYQASIVKAYTITKLRKVLNGPPTKQYAHLVVKQHYLNRFLFSGMLLSRGQVRIASHMWDGAAKMPDPPYAAQCCSSLYFTQYFELQSDCKIAHPVLSLRRLHRHPAAARATSGPSTAPSRPPPAFPTTVRQSGTPRHRSAWFGDRHGR